MINPLGLFQGFGVELEYMIVDKDSLKVKPITDEVIKEVTGKYVSDYEEEEIAWSNEIVLHVIELKTNGPSKSLINLGNNFQKHVNKINELLKKYNSVLLPSGAHPFYDPHTETKLWPHENNPVYESYNRIFDCRGHGWSNLQSNHINLPFKNDDEFGKLHAAIRLLLPIIPAIAASTPILDGKFTDFTDSRLEVYRKNQIKIPSITGLVIPEKVFTKREYEDVIFKRIWKDISPFDTEGILQQEWLNSRGAIARFERNTIEIRVVDIQECVKADIALTGLFVCVLKELIDQKNISYEEQKKYDEKDLAEILLDTIKYGEESIIRNKEYLKVFGIKNKTEITAGNLWENIYTNLNIIDDIIYKQQLKVVETILEYGTLSTRIKKALGNNPSKENIISVYKRLAESLSNNEMFLP